MGNFILNSFSFLLIALSLRSETFLLKPARFASFSFNESENKFFLNEDSDHRSRVYKIDINGKSKAKFFEKNDDNKDFILISEKHSSIFDSTTILNGDILRTISICFFNDKGESPDSFHIEITDKYSKFTKSDASIFGNHIECGYLVSDKIEPKFDYQSITKLRKNELFGYAYGAKNISISENDLKLIIESNKKFSQWNNCASNCVVISKNFIESSYVNNDDLIVLKKCGSKFFELSSEFETNIDGCDDDGLKQFFRISSIIYSHSALEYSKLIKSIESGNKPEYQESSSKLRHLAILKYNKFKHFIDRLKLINESGVNAELQDFFRIWGASKYEDSKTTNNNSAVKINIGDKVVAINENDWEVLKQESEYSVNLSKKYKRANEKYNQIVTIFNIEMTKDRKSGIKLSDNIYFEAFKTGIEEITINIRIDKGLYWVLSRQTFSSDNDQILSTGEYADESKALLLAKKFDDEISNTIFIVNKFF
jgi:hypothetical protein